eukprot:CAMPEP_0206530718 /NCGR_PEP_ID=MMETSP0325_2-20121206/3335_1 /ASSEMBLY_ACC=CAM_ASM_000347 /TAXON_ID=2866 /ORGANISM="Crypthecodinium cohnii, Strain Seligo" /LENGTH=538 /DNA_ID=CAMNT_0054026821 /DNA_START=176 /DNA_END=1788 /DNA_ORIENTATION=+
MPNSARSSRSRSRSNSPSSRPPLATGTLQLQAMQFFDDWHAKIMKTLGKEWTRRQAVTTALDLLAYNGIPLSQDDIEWMSEQPEELLIPELCNKLTVDQRESFEDLAQTLQVMLVTICRVRLSVDADDIQALEEVMNEEDHGSIKDAVLRETVVCGARDVNKLYTCQDTWVNSMEKRMNRLTKSAEVAAAAQQTLLKVEAQLESTDSLAKRKLKKSLVTLVAGSDVANLAGAFGQWAGLTIKTAAERKLRQNFDKKIEDLEVEIVHARDRSLFNIRSGMDRGLKANDNAVLGAFFGVWQEEYEVGKRVRAEEAAISAFKSKLENFSAARMNAVKAVFTRMVCSNDDTLLYTAFRGFAQAVKSDKVVQGHQQQMEVQQSQIEVHLAKCKTDVRQRLETGLLQNNNALVQVIFEKWGVAVGETRTRRVTAARVKESGAKLKSLVVRQKATALNVEDRAAEQLTFNLLLRIMQAWELEAKVNRVEKYFRSKIEGKRKQLDSVRVLFRSFADKLDEGLTVSEADSGRTSSRTGRRRGLSGSV